VSTNAIRKALEYMRGIALTADQSKARVEALDEVEAIEKAARALTDWNDTHRNHRTDQQIYDSSTAFGLLERIAKDAP
jgi:hypothetical protein